METKERLFGCMIGGAVGDALGYPVEFMDGVDIREKYGLDGVRSYQLNADGKALISDDTQMSLYTANGILIGMYRGHYRGIMGRPDMYCRHTYLDWLTTQTEKGPRKDEYTKSWLNQVPELFAMRAPGLTCLQSLNTIKNNGIVSNNSCGCGGIMRVAPWGLIAAKHYSYVDIHTIDLVGAEIARITHKHPLGFMPAAVFTHLIYRAAEGKIKTREDLENIIHEALDTLANIIDDETGKRYEEVFKEDIEKFQGIIRDSLWRASCDARDEVMIEQMARGWTGHEALAIAIFCCWRHIDNFEDAVSAAVSHRGDSDSTGAICGNLIGAILGINAIPGKFKEGLEIRDVIEEMAEDIDDGIIDHYDDNCDREKAIRQMRKYEEGQWPVK